MAPARQSRCTSHQPASTSSVMIETHQIAGVPMPRTSREHLVAPQPDGSV